jgi:hypothetical protein
VAEVDKLSECLQAEQRGGQPIGLGSVCASGVQRRQCG